MTSWRRVIIPPSIWWLVDFLKSMISNAASARYTKISYVKFLKIILKYYCLLLGICISSCVLCRWRKKLNAKPNITKFTINILVLAFILKRSHVWALVKDAKATTFSFGLDVEVSSLPSSKVLIFIIGLVCFLHTSINNDLLTQINLDVSLIMKYRFVAWWKPVEGDVSDVASLRKSLKDVCAVICPSKIFPYFPSFALVFTSSPKRFISHLNFLFPFTTLWTP